MDTLHRQKIKRNIKRLSDLIEFHKIVNLLLNRGIFTNLMIEDIKTENTNKEKNQKLLNDLCTRGPTAFEKFCVILKETNHHQAFKILSENEDLNIQLNMNQEVESETDSSETDSTRRDQPAQRIEKVQLATKWIEDSECYKLHSDPRGLCLIINNYDFKNIKETRYGSDRDAKMLESVFDQLGYKVDTHRDKEAEEMIKIFKEFAQRKEHNNLDSCVIIIMSHGDTDIVYGTDCEKVYIKDVYKLFNNANCSALIGKPKLIFIQSCRGEKFDGVTHYEYPRFRGITSDGNPIPQIEKRSPIWSDILITYCTIRGYKAFRDKALGSWFIQQLIDVLMRRAYNTDLETMLNEVSRNVGDMSSLHGEKQALHVEKFGWRYKVFFNPGLKKIS